MAERIALALPPNHVSRHSTEPGVTGALVSFNILMKVRLLWADSSVLVPTLLPCTVVMLALALLCRGVKCPAAGRRGVRARFVLGEAAPKLETVPVRMMAMLLARVHPLRLALNPKMAAGVIGGLARTVTLAAYWLHGDGFACSRSPKTGARTVRDHQWPALTRVLNLAGQLGPSAPRVTARDINTVPAPFYQTAMRTAPALPRKLALAMVVLMDVKSKRGCMYR